MLLLAVPACCTPAVARSSRHPRYQALAILFECMLLRLAIPSALLRLLVLHLTVAAVLTAPSLCCTRPSSSHRSCRQPLHPADVRGCSAKVYPHRPRLACTVAPFLCCPLISSALLTVPSSLSAPSPCRCRTHATLRRLPVALAPLLVRRSSSRPCRAVDCVALHLRSPPPI